MSHWFACEIEEIIRPGGAGASTVRRVDRGFATGEGTDSRGFLVEAATEPFDDMLSRLESRIARPEAPSLAAIPPFVSVRVLTRASAVSTGSSIHAACMQVVALSMNGMSIVATPQSMEADLATLVDLAGREPVENVEAGSLPLAWQNGSAAVLLHEAVGHPAERGLFASTIPSWLRVDDAPSSGELVIMTIDDVGAAVSTRELTSRRRPTALRRWSHRDIPARRLTNLLVRGSGPGLTKLPATRVDVLLVAEGYWDPSNDTVGVRIVAADLVDGRHRLPLEPFFYTTQRESLFPLMAGWFGESVRHPGVLCGDEGVPLPVGSASVGILTEAR